MRKKRGICVGCKNFGSMLTETCYSKKAKEEILGCQYFDPGRGLAKGSKPEHRQLAEKAIGRKLRIDEFVHHLKGNGYDHRPSNLLICDTATHAYLHTLMHGGCFSTYYPLPKKKTIFAMFRFLKSQHVPATVLDRFRESMRCGPYHAEFAHEFMHEKGEIG